MNSFEQDHAVLSLCLLGPFHISLNKKPLSGLTSEKVRGLLAFLAMESNRAHRRDTLAEMFWPNRPRGVGRNNLKQTIAILRKELGDRHSESPFLFVSRDEIKFNQDSTHTLDVSTFRTLVNAAQDHDPTDLEDCAYCTKYLRKAVDTYRGDFLGDFSISDSLAFEEWSMVQRESLRQEQARSLRCLISCYEKRSDLQHASAYARKLVELESWNEENHRTLMRLYAERGMRSRALRQYQKCARIMQDEFGVEPAEETTALMEDISDWSSRFSQSSPIESSIDQMIIPSSADKPLQKHHIISRLRGLPKWSLPLAGIVLVGSLVLVLFNIWSGGEFLNLTNNTSDEPSNSVTSNDNEFSPLMSGDIIPFVVGSGTHWYVSEVGDDDDECKSPKTACASINGVLWNHDFTDGDTIYVASGAYPGHGSEVVLLHQDAALSGGWNSNFTQQIGMTILDGDGQRRCLTVSQSVSVVAERFGFINGSSTNGGGILSGGNLVIRQSSVDSNIAVREGGGIHIQSGAILILDKSTISHNEATSGGGIFNGWGTLQISNSTISWNDANGGGGINNLGGVVKINNSTVSDNHVSTMGGGGIRNEDGGKVNLMNTILAENHGYGPDCNGVIESSGYNLIGDISECSFIGSQGDLVNLRSQLGGLADNGGLTFTHALLKGSPAIDSGAPEASLNAGNSCEFEDQRGVIRPMNGDSSDESRCDIGAYELAPNS